VLNCRFNWKQTVAMTEKRPFLEDGSQFGVSRTQFRRMRKAEKRELMVQWFHQNFEDPAERTSYVTAEGGYLWNHGGPHDATEQLFDMFGSIVSEKLIEEVAEEVEAGGITEWASAHDDYEEEGEFVTDAPSLDDYSDDPNERYGSAQDHEARERARAALQNLLAMLDTPKPAGMGHNNPPEGIEDAEPTEKLREDATALHAEFGKTNPSISLAKKLGTAIGKAGLASIKWVGKKIDLAIDTTITKGIPTIGPVIAATYNDQIHKVIDAVRAWLELVAQKM
jgi:hypothetical protein